jgi:hypothetical protein
MSFGGLFGGRSHRRQTQTQTQTPTNTQQVYQEPQPDWNYSSPVQKAVYHCKQFGFEFSEAQRQSLYEIIRNDGEMMTFETHPGDMAIVRGNSGPAFIMQRTGQTILDQYRRTEILSWLKRPEHELPFTLDRFYLEDVYECGYTYVSISSVVRRI